MTIKNVLARTQALTLLLLPIFLTTFFWSLDFARSAQVSSYSADVVVFVGHETLSELAMDSLYQAASFASGRSQIANLRRIGELEAKKGLLAAKKLKHRKAAKLLSSGSKKLELYGSSKSDRLHIERVLTALATLYFRRGNEKRGSDVLAHLFRFSPDAQLNEGGHPPIFVQIWKSIQRRALAAPASNLVVNGKPEQSIWVDAKYYGTGCLGIEGLLAGEHTLRFVGAAGDVSNISLDLLEGQTTYVDGYADSEQADENLAREERFVKTTRLWLQNLPANGASLRSFQELFLKEDAPAAIQMWRVQNGRLQVRRYSAEASTIILQSGGDFSLGSIEEGTFSFESIDFDRTRGTLAATQRVYMLSSMVSCKRIETSWARAGILYSASLPRDWQPLPANSATRSSSERVAASRVPDLSAPQLAGSARNSQAVQWAPAAGRTHANASDADKEKPVWEKAWFWGAIGGAAVLGVGSYFLIDHLGSDTEGYRPRVVW